MRETFREYAFRRGAWPPIVGTPIHVGLERLCDALVDYVDAQLARPTEGSGLNLADANSNNTPPQREESEGA